MNRMKIALAALGVVAMSAPAVAQNVNANNLISVDISNVANNIARDLDVNVSQIPVTVQVPIGIAATVCDIEANIFARGGDDGQTECTATSTSEALTQVTGRQLIEQ